MTAAVFGTAAVAQPAIGRVYTAGRATDMVDLYNDVNGGPLIATAATGALLLSAGLILYGVAVGRSGLAPRLAGITLVVGGPLVAIVGVVLANFVQSPASSSWRTAPSGSPRPPGADASRTPHARSSANCHLNERVLTTPAVSESLAGRHRSSTHRKSAGYVVVIHGAGRRPIGTTLSNTPGFAAFRKRLTGFEPGALPWPCPQGDQTGARTNSRDSTN